MLVNMPGFVKNILIVSSIAWLLMLFFARPVSSVADDLIGELIAKKSRGLIPNSESFIHHSILELLVLTAIGGLCISILFILHRCLIRKSQELPRISIKLAVSGFILLNVFVFCAAQTTIFWLTIYIASPTYKQPFFETNRTLLKSSKSPQKVVIVGSSQGQSQFEIGEFNRQFYPNVQFANFSYPGASAWDFQLIFEQYKSIKPVAAIIYLSEMNIYQKGQKSGRIIPLSDWSTFPIIYRHISQGYLDRKHLPHAIYSLLLPSFKIRRSLEVAVLGTLASNGFQPFRPASKISQLENPRKLENYARNYGISKDTVYQKNQLFTFIDKNLQQNILPILVIGQVNPILTEAFQTQMKSDFKGFIHDLKSKYENDVVFVEDEKLRHSEHVYDDFMHINRKERLKYTKDLAIIITPHLEGVKSAP